MRKALQATTELGLIQRYKVNGQLFIQVNTDTFYELQTYIPKAKREEDKSAYPAPPAESQQVALSSTECNSALLSVPSPFSLHPTPSPSPSGNTHACPSPPDTDCVSSSDEDEGANEKQEGVSDNGQQRGPGKKAATKVKSLREEYSADFEAFWKAYPRKKEKRRAWRVWKTRIRERVAPADLIQAATNYAATCRGKEERYVKLAATFLGPDRPYEEYLKGVDGDGQLVPLKKIIASDLNQNQSAIIPAGSLVTKCDATGDTVTCPECGREITVLSVALGNQTKRIVPRCRCQVEQEERWQAEIQERERKRRIESLFPTWALGQRFQECTFESFKPRPGTENALKAAQEFAASFPPAENRPNVLGTKLPLVRHSARSKGPGTHSSFC